MGIGRQRKLIPDIFGILNVYQISIQIFSLVSQFAGSIISIQPHYWRYIKRVKTNVIKMEHYTTEQFTCIETCDKKLIETNDFLLTEI